MEELVIELGRLYLPAGFPAEVLRAHFGGEAAGPIDLLADGATRAIVIPFDRQPGDGEDGHWQRLCEVANALQEDLALPAPAVSISGASGYRLWLSFDAPLPLARAQQFLDALRAAYFADVSAALRIDASVEVPPCRHAASGKWAAFIHPGMGASFADAPGLEMAPPFTAQAAFLEGLGSIGAAQLQHAFGVLERAAAPAPASQPASQSAPAGVPAGLLLKDATLEDIVRFLHAKNIEPTFRHLLPR